MADDLKNRPIIIKRKKVVGGDGHHGGAWKVAYADFVTAMMAFFMLMWLLNATTEQQRKGIADYFSPNVPIARISGGGEGAFGGESPFSELSVAQNGTGATNRRPTEGRQSLGASGTNFEDQPMGDQHMQAANQFLEAAAAQDAVLAQALAHVQMRVTDEGLIIEIFSRPEAPLFSPDGAAGDILRILASVMVELFDIVTNPLIDPIQMRVSYPNLPPRQCATSALPVNASIGYRAPMPVPFDATPSTPLDLGDVAVTMPLIDDIQPERAKAAVMPPITPTGPVSDFELVVTQPEAAAPMVRPDTTARGAGEDAAPPLAGADRDLALAIDRSAPEYPPKFQTAAERAPNLPNVTRDAHDLIEPQDPPNGVYSGGQAASVVPNIAPLAAPSPLTVTSQAQPVFAAQIGAQIDRHIAATPIAPNSTGVTEFTLNPPELGRLRMVISNSEAGAMSLTILADCPEVADLMRRHSQILVQEFMREGLNHTAIKIEASAPAAQTATPTVPQASSGPQGLNLWADAHAQGQNPQRQNPQSHHNQQDRPVPDEPRSVVGAGVDARAIMVAAPIPTTRTLDLRL